MIIGINAAAAIKQPRTGVEEYTYQLIKHLTMLPEAVAHRFFLYTPHLSLAKGGVYFDFDLPENFEVKELRWPAPMWTQMRLTSHLVSHKPDVLFIPVHILPFIHPANSVVTIHGLEYEYFPEYYPMWFRRYLRWNTKYAARHAKKIVAVSDNTKKDLIKLYGARPEKIEVVHHGISIFHSGESENPNSGSGFSVPPLLKTSDGQSKPGMTDKLPYLLYIGRIELKKNILGILEAYKILKEKYHVPHELILAGSPGFGFEKICSIIHNSESIIHKLGYVSERDKWRLLAGASVFLFPSFYEGFGLPILEAQTAGVPVVASNTSCIPEVVAGSALMVDPENNEQIAAAVYKIIDDKVMRDKLIRLGFENVKRFSWEKCARETLKVLLEG